MTLRQLTLADAEFIAHRLVVELMSYDDEPMPPFNTRSPGVLESCLAEPFQTFGAKPLHRTFAKSSPKDKAVWQAALEVFFKENTVPLPKQN